MIMPLSQFITENEAILRLSFFAGVMLFMMLWEALAPKRVRVLPRMIRWTNNLALVALNTVVVRLLFPAAAVGVAAFAESQGWGFLNYYTFPPLVAIVGTVIFMDFIIYLQHVMVHAVPALWRLHRVHHADLDYDVTTGLRFHPIEIVLSMLIKFATIIVIGAPVVAVIIFEIILNAMAMFNHANIGLPKAIDTFLRWFVVTPDMHRVHHSVEDDEANSNFGFNLTWWDRLFGTYKLEPRTGHQSMIIGIHRFNMPKQVAWLPGMLVLPFKGKISSYAINRRNWTDEVGHEPETKVDK